MPKIIIDTEQEEIPTAVDMESAGLTPLAKQPAIITTRDVFQEVIENDKLLNSIA